VEVVVNADLILPLMIMTILRSEPPQLISTSKYMNDFSFHSNVTDGMNGYIFTTFQSVIAFFQNAEQMETLKKVSSQIGKEFGKKEDTDFSEWRDMCKDLSDKNPFFSPFQSRNFNGSTLLFNAVYFNDVERVKFFCEFDMDSTMLVNYLLENALNHAIIKQYNAVLDLILSKLPKGDVNNEDSNGRTFLHYAAIGQNLHAFRQLLKSGANINAVDKEGLSSTFLLLLNSIGDQTEEIFHFLLANKADLKLKTSSQSSIVHTSKGEVLYLIPTYIIEEFLEDRNDMGETPLLQQVGRGDLKGAQFLIDKGASIEVENTSGSSILHYAVASESADVTQFILQVAKSKLHSQDIVGNTPVHLASIQGNPTLVDILIGAGANLMTQNYDQKYPGDVASTKEVENIIDSRFIKDTLHDLYSQLPSTRSSLISTPSRRRVPL
jgi:ankyrin repeat protein